MRLSGLAITNQKLQISKEKQNPDLLYKNKKVPKRKTYNLGIDFCKGEVKKFIEDLKQKFKYNFLQLDDIEQYRYEILIQSEGIEDISCKINITLQEKLENNTEIELDCDFKSYYKNVFKTGLIGILVVFSILTVSIGALNLNNLVSLGYLFGTLGLFGVSLAVLGIFVWNKSLAFHTSVVETLYRGLDLAEKEFIDEALKRFRESKVLEKPKEITDTCYFCNAPLTKIRKKGVIVCPECHGIPKTCSVCLLNINYGDSTLKCPHCNSIAHQDHLREWLKIKSYCPYCKQEIKELELDVNLGG